MAKRTKLSGVAGRADTLTGGTNGTDFQFVSDAPLPGGSYGTLRGDPGHAGNSIAYSMDGYRSTTDVFRGNAKARDVLYMGHGPAALFLEQGADIDSAGKQHLFSVEEIVGGSGGQVIDLTSDTYRYGNVKITGGSGSDVLASNSGRDTINGGKGNDTIWGGSGNDSLLGAAGETSFRAPTAPTPCPAARTMTLSKAARAMTA